MNVNSYYILDDDNYKFGAIYNKKSNLLKVLDRTDIVKIDKWINAYKTGKLSQEEEFYLTSFLKKSFDSNFRSLTKISEDNFINSGSISELRLMVQLGCNLKCKYCYANEGTYGNEENIILSPHNAKLIIDSLIESGINNIEHISFFGGEPTIYYESIIFVMEYIKDLVEMGTLSLLPRFYIVTNGTYLTEELIDSIIKFNVNLTVSIDGPKEINDALRIFKNDEGTYDKVINNLKTMRNKGIHLSMVEATYTLEHEKMNITREFVTEYLKNITGAKLVMLVDCVGNKYTPNKNKNNELLIESIKSVYAGNLSTQEEYNALSLISIVIKQLYNKKIENNLHCSAGYRSLSINGNGDYFPCHRYTENREFRLGNIIEDKTLLIHNNNTKDSIEECVNCWAAQFCNACSWDLRKNLNKELAICKHRRIVYKTIILEYINLNEERKRILEYNISSSSLKKSLPLISSK